MSIIQAAIYRLVAELACLAGVIAAAVLAYADKSAWVWCWFLIFACFNVVTGSVKTSETKITTNNRDARASA